MKILVISPNVSWESASELAKALKADHINPYKEDRRNFLNYDLVFNYGCNRNMKCNGIINTAKAVANCVDKIKTYTLLKANNIPTVNVALKKEDIDDKWKVIVARESATGAGGEGLKYFYDKKEIDKDYAFFTEYYKHKFEFRIVVFKGVVVGRYLKDEEDGAWFLREMDKEGFEEIDKSCIQAAEALGIDYVGFDVLSTSQKNFRILEANSGPIITEEVISHISKVLEVVHA